MWEGVSRVALQLIEHNEKAYKSAIRMMEQYGKAAIVHLTGTGKIYIAFKLIEDNPEKVVIWLSPSEYIFKTQLESLKRNDPDFPLANVHFYTYAKLMCCTQAQLEKIAAQKPAYIIFDEFHRAGAECWGESTLALLKLCPDAKLLGLTATDIRYPDNNRDMAEEFFSGHIANEMTLGEAVVRGILPAPKYATTVYQYQKTLAKYQARVDNLRTPGIQDASQKYLDALRRALEQADGLDKVLAHYMACKQWAYPKGKLTDEQVERLSRIGMYWGNCNDRQRNEAYQEAKRYFDAHGVLNVPADYVLPGGYNLGNWVKRQRYTRQNPEKSCAVLTEERIAKLDAIGMRWEKSNPKQLSERAAQAETVTAKAG